MSSDGECLKGALVKNTCRYKNLKAGAYTVYSIDSFELIDLSFC